MIDIKKAENETLNIAKVQTPNAETIQAIEEVKELKRNPNKKTYGSFDEILEELDDEEI